MSRRLGLALLLVTVGALALRLPEMQRRPMHNDEAVNALKLRGLWEQGTYRYDPDEFHGPVLLYATLPALWLSRAGDFTQVTERTLRVVPVVFGALLIILLGLLADGLGRTGVLLAGGFTAISPAMVFYSRYFVHETLLVCFTLLLLAAGWRYIRSRRAGWAILAGAAVGLMYATKETFVIPLAAMTGAAFLTVVWKAWWDPKQGTDSQGMPSSCLRTLRAQIPSGLCNGKHALAALAVGALVSIVFFTSFFTNASGPLDALRTYLPWLNRAGGASPHIHPWHFYLERLLWFHQGRGPVFSEAVIVILAGVGLVAALRGRGLGDAQLSCVRFVAFYTVLLTGAYSVISYKTPWCLMGFLHGMILLAGVGAAVVLRWPRHGWLRAVAGLGLVIAAGHLAWQAWQVSYELPADRRNPYAYAQTAPDIFELVEKVQAIARVHPDGDRMLIKVMAPDGDYWPLPWYLRQFPDVGWWDTVPKDPFAPVMIVGASLGGGLKSMTAYNTAGLFSLRPTVFVELHVESALWKRYLASKSKAD